MSHSNPGFELRGARIRTHASLVLAMLALVAGTESCGRVSEQAGETFRNSRQSQESAPIAGTEDAARSSETPAPVARRAKLPTWSYEVVRSYPHDPAAFTQGLAYRDGYLYEGTGRRGASGVRQVELRTGRVVRQVPLPAAMFGEGITILGDRLIQLTWVTRLGFVYDMPTLRPVERFQQVADGWGLAHDGTYLIQSDGSAQLYRLDPGTFQLIDTLQVRDESGPVDQINELEMIDGEIVANVWHSDELLRISPVTGAVVGRVDLSGIIDPRLRTDPEAVLNGIAYDADEARIFVTGKLWPRLFEIRFVTRNSGAR